MKHHASKIQTIGYPALAQLVELIAEDNSMRCRSWPNWPLESDEMERAARLLRRDGVLQKEIYSQEYESELEIMAMGEEGDKEKLMARATFARDSSLRLLDSFLNEVFDGKYHYNFFERI
jgi:hypothetical protein